MCGFTGIYAFNDIGYFYAINVHKALRTLEHRGPDTFGFFSEEYVSMGHRRLSIIGTGAEGRQPFHDASGRYVLVYNGEVFNFKLLRTYLAESYACTFVTSTDTEVLLHGLLQEGVVFLQRVHGFFAFCLYDRQEQSMLLARDRFGIKPLLYSADEDKCLFGSELRAILAYGIEGVHDSERLQQYLQLNYQPEPATMYANVQKLKPGHLLKIRKKEVVQEQWYYPPTIRNHTETYDQALEQVRRRTEEAVLKRLVSDVPLGSFLSGGIDSSIVAGLAAKHQPNLHTFSVGYTDAPYYDETHYARLVSAHFKTRHSVFRLSKQDLLDHLYPMLDALDEPFADSSALAVYILAKKTRAHVTVALSGDGADEYFGGYVKHKAEYMVRQYPLAMQMLQLLLPLVSWMPQTRANPIGNLVRRAQRMAKGAGMQAKDRYLFWASISTAEQAARLLLTKPENAGFHTPMLEEALDRLSSNDSLQGVLDTDMRLVLPGDMLYKVDRMSMAHGLEVRVPFLDHDLVEYVQSLPDAWKVNGKGTKMLLRDAFRDFLPKELYSRRKQGFEVPIADWLRNELRPVVEEDLLSESFVQSQGVFDAGAVMQLRKQLFSSSPGDAPARVWALLVYQYWWKKQVHGRKKDLG
jgi:asparagine synthase (glutamine-hydrolysing)